MLFLAKILPGANAFQISDIEERKLRPPNQTIRM
jgi:hypothetical protein